jgi:hypothetical protein
MTRRDRIARILRDAAFAVGTGGYGCESAIEIAIRDTPPNLRTDRAHVIDAACDYYRGRRVSASGERYWDYIVATLDKDKQRRFWFFEGAADFYGGGN